MWSQSESHTQMDFSLRDNTFMQPSVSRSVQFKSLALTVTLVVPSQSIRDEQVGRGRGASVLELIN